jgi:hypothetical protein
MPISLSAADHAAIERAARPLDSDRRHAFVTACMSALEGCPVLGPGVVHRTIRSLQRAYWDPPTTNEGHATHFAGRSKLRSGSALF